MTVFKQRIAFAVVQQRQQVARNNHAAYQNTNGKTMTHRST